jgi:hypothetical protein
VTWIALIVALAALALALRLTYGPARRRGAERLDTVASPSITAGGDAIGGAFDSRQGHDDLTAVSSLAGDGDHELELVHLRCADVLLRRAFNPPIGTDAGPPGPELTHAHQMCAALHLERAITRYSPRFRGQA